jgi:hypothetical protein
MLTEAKILFDNIKNFRYLLTEAVSDKTIADAINQHKYLYIYYEGDETVETGYRTIRPFVLGVTGAGNLAVRAWQDKGRSDSLRPDSPRNRAGHEHHTDTDGRIKVGWRLFIIDNIKEAYPTGRKFNNADGNVMIPPGYKENDKQMTGGILASISSTPEKVVQAKQEIPAATAFKAQTSKWQSFFNANVNKRKPKPADIENLYSIAKKVMKQSPNDFFVAIDDKNQFSLKDNRIKDRFPKNAIVGGLTNLYDTIVRKIGAPTPAPEEDRFIKQEKEKALTNNTNKENIVKEVEENLPRIPFERKPFFKI